MNKYNEYLIVWEKWKDPLGYDDDSDDTADYDKSDYEDTDSSQTVDKKIKKIKCNIITTPFGIIPVNENTASSEIFNFWTGHTNFPVTKTIEEIIEDIDGVETLNVFTKYRFRIAVGKAFTDSEVMRNINSVVYDFLNTYVK